MHTDAPESSMRFSELGEQKNFCAGDANRPRMSIRRREAATITNPRRGLR